MLLISTISYLLKITSDAINFQTTRKHINWLVYLLNALKSYFLTCHELTFKHYLNTRASSNCWLTTIFIPCLILPHQNFYNDYTRNKNHLDTLVKSIARPESCLIWIVSRSCSSFCSPLRIHQYVKTTIWKIVIMT